MSTTYSFEDEDGIVREKRIITPSPGGGGAPSGPAGGSLNGTYPNPGIANGAVALLQLAAAIKPSGTALPADEAVRAIGINADTACAGNDSRLSDSRTPTGAAGGDLTGSYPGPTIDAGKVTATKIAAALKPSGTASPSTEALRAIGTTGDTACGGNDSRLTDSRAPNGSAGGDLTDTYPNPTLGTSGVTAATYGDATHVAQVAVDAKGRITSASNVAISGGGSGWDTNVNLDGTSVAALTQQSGSWSSSGGEILVSPAAGTKVRAYVTAVQRQAVGIWEAQVKMKSTGSHAGTNQIGLVVQWDGSSATGGILYALAASGLTPASNGGDYTEQSYGVATGPSNATRFNLDTFYTLRVIVSGDVVECYRDGTLLAAFAGTQNVGTSLKVALYALNCDAAFKNVKLYNPTVPA